MFLQLICQKNLVICPDVFHHIDFEDYIPVVQKKIKYNDDDGDDDDDDIDDDRINKGV